MEVEERDTTGHRQIVLTGPSGQVAYDKHKSGRWTKDLEAQVLKTLKA